MRIIGFLVLGALVGCSPNEPEPTEKQEEMVTPTTNPSPEEAPDLLQIVPGECIGPICLGTTYSELRDQVGEIEEAMGYRRIILGRYSALGIEVSLASSDEFVVTDDSYVVAVGTLLGDSFGGPIRPGLTEEELQEAIGDTPKDVVGDYIFLPTGVSVLRDEEGTVIRVGIYPAYTIRSTPPAMEHASTTLEEGETP